MKPEFLIERNGKQFVLYAGLLDEAHRQGLKQISTRLIQVPADDNGNVAICQAEVITERGTFGALGDAAPVNVARAMQTCLIRMAETRAKARALRDAINVGVAAVEEMEGEEPPRAARAPRPASQAPAPQTIQAPAAAGDANPPMISASRALQLAQAALKQAGFNQAQATLAVRKHAPNNSPQELLAIRDQAEAGTLTPPARA